MANEVEENLKRFINNQLPNILEETMNNVVLEVEADAKKNCPVDNGQLRASIASYVETSKTKVAGYIGSNLEYAPYVHQGTGIYAKEGNGRKTGWGYEDENGDFHLTKGQKPNPFLQKAIDSNKNNIIKAFEGVV